MWEDRQVQLSHYRPGLTCPLNDSEEHGARSHTSPPPVPLYFFSFSHQLSLLLPFLCSLPHHHSRCRFFFSLHVSLNPAAVDTIESQNCALCDGADCGGPIVSTSLHEIGLLSAPSTLNRLSAQITHNLCRCMRRASPPQQQARGRNLQDRKATHGSKHRHIKKWGPDAHV